MIGIDYPRIIADYDPPRTTEPEASMTTKEQFQTVQITLSDGRVGLFSGPALVDLDDDDLTVTAVDFTEPQDLPEGFRREMVTIGEEE